MTASQPWLVFMSHGLKSGPLPKADLYLDCRCIENPFRISGLCNGSADGEQKLIAWMYANNLPIIEAMMDMIDSAVHTLPARRRDETNPWARPLTVCFFCAYGQHRSVTMKRIVAKELTDTEPTWKIEVA